MTLILKPEQEAWLKSRVASGEFASINEAALQLIDERIAEYEFDADDMAWAKPFVDEALAAVERGEVISREEYTQRMDAHMASLRP